MKSISQIIAILVLSILTIQGSAQNSLVKVTAKQVDSLLPHNWLMTMIDMNGEKKPPLEKAYMNFRTDKTVTMEDLASGKMNYVWSYDEETNKITCKSKEDQDVESFSIIKISSTELVLSYVGKGYSVAVVTYLKRVD